MPAIINFIAQHSQGCLAIETNEQVTEQHKFADPGAPIVHYVMHVMTLGQVQFRMEQVDSVWYRIVAVHPYYAGMVLDVAGASQADGAPIILWPWHGGSNQRFRTRDAPSLSTGAWGYSLQAQHSGKVLDVLGGSGGQGVPL